MQSSDKLEIHEYLHTSISSGFFLLHFNIWGWIGNRVSELIP